MSNFTDAEKAAALDEIVREFADSWVDVNTDNNWVVIDGSAKLTPETVRILDVLFEETR